MVVDFVVTAYCTGGSCNSCRSALVKCTIRGEDGYEGGDEGGGGGRDGNGGGVSGGFSGGQEKNHYNQLLHNPNYQYHKYDHQAYN